ncbi:GTPase activating protein Sec23b [Schizosaccharomyces japonicus yFS275]|uniref:Protein transport protein SEC23 n=1 Tax=Schizosaccharomyces japonicus (strain yFS275 / FY16936) TaxID=402676 RepID=B6K3G9_SCHJY|nr:GTPase activating protein Sec23b [Schizosaccharomyces japonicus yFS275]EEB08026.1 GTPase activating protein Sec23b [Schizosaccharomyces japonicus yFS275]
MDFETIEERDGVRFSWNVFPSGKAENSRLVIPIASLYRPLNDRSDVPTVFYEPVVCKAPCHAALNPYCQVDTRAKFWICPFCLQRNPLPHQYKDISSSNLPIELMGQSTTIEYTLSRPVKSPPVFLFVMDTMLDQVELQALKSSIIVTLSLLPPDAIVGLITFGSFVQVHEISSELMAKSYAFGPNVPYTPKQLQQLLALTGAQYTAHTRSAAIQETGVRLNLGAAGRFLMPVQQCEFQISNILEQLQPEVSNVPTGQRPKRCTGAALNIAAGLLELTSRNTGARVMLFAGGPCTVGAGQVVSLELKEPMRSHSDIIMNKAQHFKKASKFYTGLTQRFVESGHTVDILIGCLDQIGLMEMECLVNRTNGNVVLSDSFNTSIFKQSFQRIFSLDAAGFLRMGFNASMTIKSSADLKVAGLVGHATSVNKKASNVSDVSIGLSGTSTWKMCSLSPSSCFAIYFTIANQSSDAIVQAKQGYVQYLTYYQHSSGTQRLRVTTIARPFSNMKLNNIAASFDQEAAAVLIARMALYRALSTDGISNLRFLDHTLIRLCQNFAEYRKNEPETFRLQPNYTLFPQFMFHLRRSPFFQVFNNSPDETSFYRHILQVEDVNNSLIMIQPTLQSYTFENPEGVPVLLDSMSIRPDGILLLDTFFHILIFHGSTIAQWRNAGYQDQPEYANFKELLEAPRLEVTELLHDRFPIPRFIVCDQGGSQARFLLSRINPSVSHNDSFGYNSGPSEAVLTEDVNLQKFMEHLRKVSVSS